jgi:hypothetical protein
VIKGMFQRSEDAFLSCSNNPEAKGLVSGKTFSTVFIKNI